MPKLRSLAAVGLVVFALPATARAERTCTAFDTDPAFYTSLERPGLADAGPALQTLQAFFAAEAAGERDAILALFDEADGSRAQKAQSLDEGQTRVGLSGAGLTDPVVGDVWKWGQFYLFTVTYKAGEREFPFQETVRCDAAGCAMSVAVGGISTDPGELGVTVHKWGPPVACPATGYAELSFLPPVAGQTVDPLIFHLPGDFIDFAALRRALTDPATIGARPPGGSLAGLTVPPQLASCLARIRAIRAEQPWELMTAEGPGAALAAILADCTVGIAPGSFKPYQTLDPGDAPAPGVASSRPAGAIVFDMKDAPVILPIASYSDRAHRVVMVYVQSARPGAGLAHALYLFPFIETENGPRLDGDYARLDFKRSALMELLLSPRMADYIRGQ